MRPSPTIVLQLLVVLFVVDLAEEVEIIGNEYGIYDVKKQRCCNGVISTTPFVHCCGTKAIYDVTTVCCKGKKVSTFNPLRRRLECCHDLSDDTKVTIYNPKVEICCQGKVLRKPNSYMVYQCCGANVYDAYTKICCHGVLHDFKFDATCCGQQLHVTSFTFAKTTKPAAAAANATVETSDFSACCGERYWIDTRSEMCCALPSSVTNTDGDPKKTYYETAIHKIGPNSKLQCCGLEAYDPSTEICCSTSTKDGTRRSYKLSLPTTTATSTYYQTPTCYEDRVITDNVAEIGCGGRVVKRSAPSIKCCNDEILYDSRTMMCCGRNILELAAKKACCPGAGALFDASHQRCCNDKITPFNDSESRMLLGMQCCMSNN